MSQRCWEGKTVDDPNGFEAVISTDFNLAKITFGRGEEFTVTRTELEAFAKWVLQVRPYGANSI